MGRNCAMGVFMTLLICICFNIVNVNAGIGDLISKFEVNLHQRAAPKKHTAVEVAPQKAMSFAGGVSYSGPVYVIDHSLTETPDPNSRELGRATGMYSLSSKGEFRLLMAMTFSIHSGKYKGGELNIAGKHLALRAQKELPIVGGSGVFRMGSGYAFAHTYSIRSPNDVIRYNVTVFH